MKLNAPQTYGIEIPNTGPYRLFNGNDACKFSKPASSSKHPKLYTLSSNGKLIYVGIASQAMSSRLSYGFRASGKGGYHGGHAGIDYQTKSVASTSTADEPIYSVSF